MHYDIIFTVHYDAIVTVKTETKSLREMLTISEH